MAGNNNNSSTKGKSAPTTPITTKTDEHAQPEHGHDEPDEKTPSDAKSTETKPNTTSAEKTAADIRQAKLDALKKRSEVSREKGVIDQMQKISLFDSTKASGWKTTGSHALGAMKTEANAIAISGRNIGAEQREPDWNEEQMAVIIAAKATILQVADVANTRRSATDSKMEYVGRDENGTIVPTERAYVSSLDASEYCIGIGPEKYDTTGSPRFYADVVVADIGGEWLVNQWTSEGIVIEGVAQNVLMQANRPGNTSGRRIGQHFARIGLPAYAFGPAFNTLNTKFPGCISQCTPTMGYYWANASWGVSSFNATFSYMTDEGKVATLANLSDVMRKLNGKSALCLATVAISLTCPATMENGKPVADRSSFGLSIKLHNAFSVDTVDYHGPPQQGSTGMIIPSRIARSAKPMGSSVTATSGGMGSIFSQAATGAFAQTSATAPSSKSLSNKSYM